MPDLRSALVGRRLRVVALDGVATLQRPTADLTFGADGRVTGCATVNRLTGTYELVGDRLTCGALASTMMAGPPEAMDQEQRLHRALSRRLTVSADETGDRLELSDDAGVAVTLAVDDGVETL